ncbi:MAG: metallophosphoesterase [Nanoarchaeota archaeon]
MKIEYIGKCLLIETGGEKILAIGDLHLGYEEALEKSGALVGRRIFAEMIEEFEGLFGRVGKVNEIVLLGDLKHGLSELGQQEREELMGTFDYLSGKCEKIIVIRGNHDNYLLNLTAKRGIEVKEHYLKEEFTFFHGNKDFLEIYDKKIKCWIMGHLHPAIKLFERRGVKAEKYKCFLEGKFKGKKIIIVPSFSSFSEGTDVRESEMDMPWKFNFEKFRVLAVGEKLEVLDFGELGRL